jgi:hypothetical protein
MVKEKVWDDAKQGCNRAIGPHIVSCAIVK